MANLNPFRIAMPLLDEPGDGGGGGNPPAPPVNNDPPTPAPAAPVPAPTPANSGWEAEKKGFIADLQKERKARQQFEQQIATNQAELAQERRRVQALAGVNPKSAEDSERDEVKQRFGELFPGLAKLTDAQITKLLSVAERADSLEEATNHHWRTHGQKMLDSVSEGVSKHMGGTLSARQTDQLNNAYAQYVGSSPDIIAQHEAGDQKLVDAFVKDFIDDWFEPARRKVTQTELERQRRVPSGRDRSIGTNGAKKVNYADDKSFADAATAAFREHGGDFNS